MDVQQLIAKGYELLTVFGVKILAALAVFIIGRWVVKYVRRLILRIMEKREVDPTRAKRLFLFARTHLEDLDAGVGVSPVETLTTVVLDPDLPARLADIDLSPVILTLLVGPEGGLTRDEAEAAQRNGFIAAATGPRTLRTETAALTGLALAQARWGDL